MCDSFPCPSRTATYPDRQPSYITSAKLTCLKLVPHLGLLRRQIGLVVLAGLDLDGDFFDDAQAVPFDAVNLLGIVGHDADLAKSQISENLTADAVVALVDGQSESLVRFDGVESALLQRVRVKLVRQADAAALLSQINQHALSGLFDHLQGRRKLIAAIAFSRAKDIAGQ